MADVEGRTEWKIEINIAGVAPLKPGTSMVHVDDGAYPGKIVGAVLVEKKGDSSRHNVMFTIQHLETNTGADGTSYKGREHRVYIPVRPLLTNAQIEALGDKEKRAYVFNQGQWRTILESIGAPPERLDANPVCGVSNDIFAGQRACFFHVLNPPAGELNEDGAKKYENVSFCNAAHYKKLREAAALAPSSLTVGGAAAQLQLRTPQPSTQSSAQGLGNLGSLLGTAPSGAAQPSTAGNGVPVLRL